MVRNKSAEIAVDYPTMLIFAVIAAVVALTILFVGRDGIVGALRSLFDMLRFG